MDALERIHIVRSLQRLAMDVEFNRIEVTDYQLKHTLAVLPPLEGEDAVVRMGTGFGTMAIGMVDTSVRAMYDKEMKRRRDVLAEIEEGSNHD